MNIFEKIDALFTNGIVESIISMIILSVSLLVLNRFLNKWLKKRWPQQYPVLRRIKRYILYTILLCGILLQFESLGPVLSGLLASGGIIAVVIGLASQEVASDILSGCMILLYKPYRIGDLVFVSAYNVKGTVLDISIRHTVIETFEKTQVTIPNTVMNKAIIENISNVTTSKNNYLFVDISYESDIDKAIECLQEEVMAHPLFVDGRSEEEIAQNVPLVKVHCMDFKDSGVSLRVSVFSKDNAEGFQMLSDLRIAILKRFNKEGIEIPYPHQTILYKKEQDA